MKRCEFVLVLYFRLGRKKGDGFKNRNIELSCCRRWVETTRSAYVIGTERRKNFYQPRLRARTRCPPARAPCGQSVARATVQPSAHQQHSMPSLWPSFILSKPTSNLHPLYNQRCLTKRGHRRPSFQARLNDHLQPFASLGAARAATHSAMCSTLIFFQLRA